MTVDAPVVGVRDSKQADGGILTFDRQAWTEFIAGVVAGEFPAR